MKALSNWKLPTFTFATLALSCVEPYPLPVLEDSSQYLVVDAFLNATEGNAKVSLSRSVNLTAASTYSPERGAQVFVTDKNNTFELAEVTPGSYAAPIQVRVGTAYQLLILLATGKKYESEWVEALSVPPIDSLSYVITDDGFQVQVNSHSDEGTSGYYFWNYDETWEYTSAFQSDYKKVNGYPQHRDVGDDIYHCWHTLPSQEILIYSTKKLARDYVAQFPLLTIPKRSEKLNVKYSILATQRSISQEAYDYWVLLKKNTESLGSLFDPLPSRVDGNIRSVNSPEESVLGYFTASTISQKRFTVELFDLPESVRFIRNFPSCELKVEVLSNIPALSETSYLIISPVPGPPSSNPGYFYANIACADCRIQGGTTQRPDYW